MRSATRGSSGFETLLDGGRFDLFGADFPSFFPFYVYSIEVLFRNLPDCLNELQ